MADQHVFFALAAIALTTAQYSVYLYTIYQGKTKPHASSWLLWGTVTGIGAFAQFNLDAGPSTFALAFVSVIYLGIAGLAFFMGERDYTKSDWVTFIACISAIPLWHITKNPLTALILIIIIDSLTYWPTIRKSFHKPQTEPPLSYGISGMHYCLTIFAVPNPNFENLIYPVFLMTSDLAFALFIIMRRNQLGLPIYRHIKTKI